MILFKRLPFLSTLVLISISGCLSTAIPVFSETKTPPADMVFIPAGPFWMGLNELPQDTPWGQDDAQPKHQRVLPDYYIDRYEVAYGAYLQFDETHLLEKRPADAPVTHVTWTDADSYCHFLGKRLPTEAEWEKAARGTDARAYPWGNIFDSKKSNTGAAPQPSGSFPGDRSPYGVFDMAGNVSEWTDSWYRPYPESTHQSRDYGIFQKVVRGGSFNTNQHFADEMFAQVTFRNYNRPDIAGSDNGFRCALSPSKD